MKLRISAKPAAFSACAAMTARVFCALAVDEPSAHSAAWLSALIGAALSIPALIALHAASRRAAGGKLAAAAFLCASLANCRCALREIVQSAECLALDRAPSFALLLPAALALLWCVTRNGDAVGYSAMLWFRSFPALLVVVFLLQLPVYRPEWLRITMLGSGWPTVVGNGIRSAGWIVSTAAIWLVRDVEGPSGDGVRPILTACAAAAGIVTGMIALRVMVTPALKPGASASWQLRLDSLLTNGRSPLYLQFPMIVIWYVGLLHLLSCAGFAAAALAQRLFPSLDGKACAAIVALAAAFLSAAPRPDVQTASLLSQWQYVALAAAALPVAVKEVFPRCSGA